MDRANWEARRPDWGVCVCAAASAAVGAGNTDRLLGRAPEWKLGVSVGGVAY